MGRLLFGSTGQVRGASIRRRRSFGVGLLALLFSGIVLAQTPSPGQQTPPAGQQQAPAADAVSPPAVQILGYGDINFQAEKQRQRARQRSRQPVRTTRRLQVDFP